MLFLQSAGAEHDTAHELVAAIREFRPAQEGKTLDPNRIAERLRRIGCDERESTLVALAVLTTSASSASDLDVEWIAAVADRLGDPDLLLEIAGVSFAFNTINRIADARRVRLEYRFLRELKPIRRWVERGLAALTGLAYDLSFRHQPVHSRAELENRLALLSDRLGTPDVPDIFQCLSRSPVVLEGVLEMIEANVTSAMVRADLLREAIAIGVASRARPNSELRRAVDPWLPREPAPGELEAACRRYLWKVANAAHTITDDQIRELHALGLSDAELLDLTLSTALFSALAIIEPISAAVARASTHAKSPQARRVREKALR